LQGAIHDIVSLRAQGKALKAIAEAAKSHKLKIMIEDAGALT
jgi:hypothetical protein